MPYNGILNFLDEILSLKIHMKSIEQEFPVKLFIMLDKVASTFESVDEIIQCDHSNESFWPAFSHSTIFVEIKKMSYISTVHLPTRFFVPVDGWGKLEASSV